MTAATHNKWKKNEMPSSMEQEGHDQPVLLLYFVKPRSLTGNGGSRRSCWVRTTWLPGQHGIWPGRRHGWHLQCLPMRTTPWRSHHLAYRSTQTGWSRTSGFCTGDYSRRQWPRSPQGGTPRRNRPGGGRSPERPLGGFPGGGRIAAASRTPLALSSWPRWWWWGRPRWWRGGWQPQGGDGAWPWLVLGSWDC